ncbi:phage tail tape measure protein, partial [Alicyclobacillus contaminans]|uniref:phage tail tape measure protein n=1 Tax=Alicyclobacillus contaminans TaxID=392016 RepID=UPI000478C721
MASEEVSSLKVTVNMDTVGFQDGISKINRQLQIAKSEFEAASASLGDFGSITDRLNVKTESLTKQIDLQRQKVDLLQRAVAQSAAEKGEDSKQTDLLTIKLNKAQAQLAAMQNELTRTTQELSGNAESMKAAAAEADSIGGLFSRLGSTIKTALVFTGVYTGIDAIGSAFKSVITTGMDFESEMSKVRALAGGTQADFERLRAAAVQLGAQSVFSASQVAEGMQNLAAAGFSTNQILAAMPGVLNAAAASGEDFASVSDIMVSTMSAFGMQASSMSHIADVLAASANASAVSIGDIGQTLQYAAPVAKAAGVSLEQLAADIAVMGNAGIKGSDAGTALRAALVRLADPPKDAATALKALGVSVTDAHGKMVPFNQLIEELHTKFQNLSQAQQLQAASAIFGQDALSGMMTLIQASPAQIEQFTKAFINSNGAAQKMADTMNDNLKGSLQQLGGAFESASITIEGALEPVLRRIVDGITSVVSVISAKNPGQAFAALFPPAIRTGVDAFANSIKAAMTDIKQAFGDQSITARAKQFFASLNIGPAVSQGLKDIGKDIQAITALFTGNTGQFRSLAQSLQVPPQVQQLFVNLANTMRDIYQVIAPALVSIFQQIFGYIKQNGPEIVAAVKNIINAVDAVLNAFWPVIKALVIDTLQSIMDTIKNAVKVIEDVISAFADLFTGNWSKLWSDIKSLATDGLKLLWDLFQLWIGSKIGAVLKGVSGIFGKYIGDAMGKMGSAVQSGWEAIVKYFSGRASYFGDLVKKAFDVVTKIPADMIKAGKDIVNGLWQGIANMGATLKANISSFIDEHIPKVVRDVLGIHSPSRVMAEVGTNVGAGLQQGIQQSSSKVQSASKSMADKVTAGVQASAKTSKTVVKQTAEDIVQAFLDGLQTKMAPLQQTLDQLQARLQFRKDQGNTAAVTETTQEIVNAYKQQLTQLQNAMNSINAEIKKFNPKTQADQIAKLKDEYSQLAVQWWNDRDALTQLTAQADKATTTVTNLLNAADNATSATDKQIQTLQAQMQDLKDAGQDTSSVAKQIGDAYNQEIKSIQSSINSLQTELKKLNPKTQADLVQQVKDKIADLNTELWNTKDALEQINTEAFQSAADTFKSTTDQDLSAMQTAMQNELSAIQQAHQQALAAFDAETKQLEDQIDAQLAALQQTQTQDDRASQQQSWDSQMEDLQHQLAVAQMMNDPRTVKQVQDQIDQLNQQIAAQQRQWAIQDQEQALQQQKQALDAQREQQRQALDQEWQDREAAFQKQMDQEMQQFQALQTALVQAIST